MRSALTAAAIVFAAIVIAEGVDTSYSGQGRVQAVANTVRPTAQQWNVATGSNNFGVELLTELRKSSKDENVVISPASISVALAMLLNGADTQTLAQAAKLLGVAPKDLPSMNTAVSDFLDAAIQADPDVELEIANGLFTQKGKKVDAQFMKTVQKEFQGRVKELDFKGDAQGATDKINDWVSQRTNGKIPKLFSTLSKDTIVVVANAIYFKSTWTMPFEESLTTERDFKLSTGAKIPVATMHHQYGHFLYLDNSDFQAISLGYGQDARFCLDVYLPKGKTTLDALATKLSADALAKHSANFVYSPGELYLPKMKISCSKQLNETLANLGMKDAFDGNKADFSKLFADKKDSFAVDVVQHETFLEVNENGTEAAAATGLSGVAASSVGEWHPFMMDVNRPFLFVIRDSQTGAIFFIGTVNNPTK